MFNHLIRGDYIKSLQEWCNENDCLQYLDFWDYEMNQISPDKIAYSTHKKYYFKCINKNHKHKSELKRIDNLVSNKFSTLTCIQCNSFGQWFIDNYSADELEKYWDFDKNIENPFFIAKNSHKKIFIKCQEQLYHESYEVNPAHFTRGTRCPYCIGRKVNYYDSLGYKYPLVLDIWSDKNEFSPNLSFMKSLLFDSNKIPNIAIKNTKDENLLKNIITIIIKIIDKIKSIYISKHLYSINSLSYLYYFFHRKI